MLELNSVPFTLSLSPNRPVGLGGHLTYSVLIAVPLRTAVFEYHQSGLAHSLRSYLVRRGLRGFRFEHIIVYSKRETIGAL